MMDERDKQYFWFGLFACAFTIFIILSIMYILIWLVTKEYFGEMLSCYIGIVLMYVVIYKQRKEIRNPKED